MTLFGYANTGQMIVNWSSILGVIMTTALFMVLYALFSNRLKTDLICTAGFGILFIVGVFAMIYVIPSIASFTNNYVMISKLRAHEITTGAFGANTALTRVISLLNIPYMVSVIMLLCAYTMYWYRGKYFPAQQDDRK